jgi:hypothetical protein
VITWLSTVEASFGNAKDGKFVALAHSNFKHIRYVNVKISSMGRHVDGILDQIREIKELQKSQLVRKKFWINHKKLTTCVMSGGHLEEAKAAEMRKMGNSWRLPIVTLVSNTTYDEASPRATNTLV